jgi:lysophospholipase L1-like esterase
MNTIKKILFTCFILQSSLIATAQADNGRFSEEIRKFSSSDSIQMPPAKAILFVGSSSFRMWHGLQDSFPEFSIINRGFGGSTLSDLIHYHQETILKYDPAQIIIYCGENDLASSDSLTPVMVLDRFYILFDLIRTRYPNVPVAFVSMKPSPSRWHLKEKYMEGNRLIKDFLSSRSNTAYIDVWNPMLENGNPRQELFIADNLHMNAKGYAIWKSIIEPYLLK